MRESAVRLHGVGKQYFIGGRHAPYKTLRESLSSLATAPWRALRKVSGKRSNVESFWALKDVSFEVERGRGRRHHRPQRRGQEHAAEDPVADHRADRGAGATSGAGSARCWRSAPGFTRS